MDRVSHILRCCRWVFDDGMARYISIHLRNLFCFEHLEGFSHIDWALLTLLRHSLVFDLDRAIVPAIICTVKKVWLLICPATHLQGKGSKLFVLAVAELFFRWLIIVHCSKILTMIVRLIPALLQELSPSLGHILLISCSFQRCWSARHRIPWSWLDVWIFNWFSYWIGKEI